MKAQLLSGLSAAMILGSSLAFGAEPAPAPATPPSRTDVFVDALLGRGPSSGLINDFLRSQTTFFTNWDVGAQFRARFEQHKYYGILGIPGSYDFRNAPGIDTENTYWLLREKMHIGYTPFPWLTAYAEARNSSSPSDQRNPNVEADTFDLQQAYLALGDKKQFPLLAKAGRQELSYGDERLIGASDWNNLGRVFDAAKLRWDQNDLSVDAFVGRMVLANDHVFNEANYYDWLSGVYASSRAISHQVTDLYFLARNTSEESTQQITTSTPRGGATQRDVYTIGLRMKSLPGTLKGWDYGMEIAGQFGDYAMTANGPRLNHTAFAAHVAGGYTFADTFGTPRLGLEYNYASGDDDPNDNQHGTFDNLFPTNHKFYGYMDFFSWQNVHDIRVSGSIKPVKKLTASLDYHAFWLASTSDYFYTVGGTPRAGYPINETAGNYVGSEIDFILSYTITPWANAQAGYGHFFIGDYIKDTLGSEAHAADWVYVQLLLNF